MKHQRVWTALESPIFEGIPQGLDLPGQARPNKQSESLVEKQGVPIQENRCFHCAVASDPRAKNQQTPQPCVCVLSETGGSFDKFNSITFSSQRHTFNLDTLSIRTFVPFIEGTPNLSKPACPRKRSCLTSSSILSAPLWSASSLLLRHTRLFHTPLTYLSQK